MFCKMYTSIYLAVAYAYHFMTLPEKEYSHAPKYLNRLFQETNKTTFADTVRAF